MGKASRWFRGLLGLNKPDPNPCPSQNHSQRNTQKKKWSFTKSHKEKDRHNPQQGVDDVNRHAMAVASATVKVAEAAVAAVQQTGRGKYTSTVAHVSRSGAGYEDGREEWAAVVIQSHFRACLSRQALRALKALVKLQALVRGHLMRKRTAEALRQLQALVRAQTRARGNRISESPHSSIKSSHFSYHGPETPEKFEHAIRARSMNHEHSMTLKRNGSKSNGSVNYDPAKSMIRISKIAERYWDERSDKILEVDTGKPPATPKQRRRSLFQSSSHLSLGSDQNCQSPSSIEVQSLSPLKLAEDGVFCTAGNSPNFYSASSVACSSKREAFTPTKSDGSRSCLSGYSDNPSYMAYTESSKAKHRSLSAPKQRSSQYERSNSTKRYSVHGYGDSRTNQRVSALQTNFTNKAYPGSGRLDRLGMPVRDVTGFSGSHWLRY